MSSLSSRPPVIVPPREFILLFLVFFGRSALSSLSFRSVLLLVASLDVKVTSGDLCLLNSPESLQDFSSSFSFLSFGDVAFLTSSSFTTDPLGFFFYLLKSRRHRDLRRNKQPSPVQDRHTMGIHSSGAWRRKLLPLQARTTSPLRQIKKGKKSKQHYNSSFFTF